MDLLSSLFRIMRRPHDVDVIRTYTLKKCKLLVLLHVEQFL